MVWCVPLIQTCRASERSSTICMGTTWARPRSCNSSKFLDSGGRSGGAAVGGSEITPDALGGCGSGGSAVVGNGNTPDVTIGGGSGGAAAGGTGRSPVPIRGCEGIGGGTKLKTGSVFLSSSSLKSNIFSIELLFMKEALLTGC